MNAIDLAERFRATLTALDGSVHICTSASEAHEIVVDICGAGAVVIDLGHPDTLSLAERLRLVDDPWKADVGVTGVDVAIAETGTLVLSWGSGRRRSTPLVPPVHVALVPLHRLVDTYADAIDV